MKSSAGAAARLATSSAAKAQKSTLPWASLTCSSSVGKPQLKSMRVEDAAFATGTDSGGTSMILNITSAGS